MKTLRNIVILLVLFGAAGWYFGSMAYRAKYVAPRKKLADARAQMEQTIAAGNNQLAAFKRVSENNMALYTRSFPINPTAARTEYQLWLTQLAEFCEMTEPSVRVGQYHRGAGIATHQFQLLAEATPEQLYRFLYEFYWTSFLHRIDSIDLQAIEGSDRLKTAIVFEGLTMAKINPRSPYPLQNQLPLSYSYQRRLSSGPFAAYSDIAAMNLFQYSKPGIDNANFTLLTGLPTVIDAEGKSVTQTRWKVESEGRTLTLGVGDRLAVGSFDGLVEAIDGDMVILKQKNGFRWIMLLGDKLANAVAIPRDF